MKLHPYIRRRAARSGEDGYFLIVMMLFLTLLAISLTAVAPAMLQQIRREREIELIHRGNQYARAIRLFYRKFGRYPTRLEELENTNNLRFLRKRYKDPMTADGNWRLIHFGEAQIANPNAPVLPGATVPGAGTAASPNAASASPFANTFGAVAGVAAAQAGTTQPNAGQIIGGSTASAASSSDSGQTGQTGSTSSGGSSQPGTAASQLGQPGGLTLGGGPIVGVASPSKKTSIKELNKKNHYNEWEFVYDPRLEIVVPQAAGSPAAGAPGVQQPGTQSGFGSPSMSPTPQQSTGPGR
jgi:type II secretory pathway pseudopilin PulG